jgi:hypothetical protein
VRSQKAATERRRASKSGDSRQITIVPSLFEGDGAVHRFDASDELAISRFFAGARSSPR